MRSPLTLFIFLAAVAFAGDVNKTPIFRNLSIGASIASISGLQCKPHETPDQHSLQNCFRSKEDLVWHGVGLQSITYSFASGKLVSVEGKSGDCSDLRAAMFHAYGTNTHSDWWLTQNISASISSDPNEPTCSATWRAPDADEVDEAKETESPDLSHHTSHSTDTSDSTCGPGRHWVSGYTTKRGKSVSGHCADNPHHN